MSIKTELKRLYTAMCGGATTKDGTAAIIGDIADNYTGGGGDITVDTEITENGTNPVTGGAIFTELSKRTEDLKVNFSVYVPTMSITADKTIAEIYAARQAGKNVYGVYNNRVFPLTLCDATRAYFGLVEPVDGIIKAYVITGVNDGSSDAWTQTIKPIDDYEVVLTVDAGTGTITADKTIAEIYAAGLSKAHVYATVTIAWGSGTITTITQHFELSMYSTTGVDFYAVQVDEDNGTQTAKPVCLNGKNIDGADVWTIVE